MAMHNSSLPVHIKQPASPRKVSMDLDPFAAPAEYYGKSHGPRKVAKSRTYSAHAPNANSIGGYTERKRRTSHDAHGNAPRQFQIDVDETYNTLLEREDTDHNVQITIEDHGPKVFALGTAASAGYKRFDVRGNYMLSNLLQELALAKQHGRKQIILDEARLNENPVTRISRLIKDHFWPNLTRRIDSGNVAVVGRDPKDWTVDPRPRIYIPHGVPEQYQYYKRISEEHPTLRLEVIMLPENPSDPEFVRDLNEAPGLLAIEMERVQDTAGGQPDFRGLPFVVPGGRFNELYGWDSYMETLGLLLHDRVDLCQSMVRHFCFSIQHYGKILNANRSYYLCRSQPPFLTDMALRTYEKMDHSSESLEFLRKAMLAAIKDYYTTWMSPPRYDPTTGLSRYVAGGIGVPPETEPTHFEHILLPYAKKYNLEYKDFVRAYNYGHVFERELDEYFLHDRSIRESGHDTSYRLENVCANLATVDLNSLLFKYESDIARTIRDCFGDQLVIPLEWQVTGKPLIESSSAWDRRSRRRRKAMEQLMWDEEKGMFFDYDTVKQKQTGYESATTFWAMWAGVATPEQAAVLVKKALPRFEEYGGLASGTEQSRGKVGINRPNRQWDYPYGWAPQQILAWTGFQRYGYLDEGKRLAYRWLYMVTRAFVDFNGVVVEKYDVTKRSGGHKVTAEYGNQGSNFQGVATEGFGWVNASYVYGLDIIDGRMRRALGAVTDWETFKRMTERADSDESAIGAHTFAENKSTAEEGKLSPAAHHQGLPHTAEDSATYKAVHGSGSERMEHKGPSHVGTSILA